MNPLSSILPRSHAVLKHVVTATGYGYPLSKDGLAKDLESMGMGKERPGSTTKLMLKFENILQTRLLNDFIKESGENAAIRALRRYGERKAGSREILDLLLEAKPSSETVNRYVSSRCETMLGLAIDRGMLILSLD